MEKMQLHAKKIVKAIITTMILIGAITFTSIRSGKFAVVKAQEVKKEKCEKLYENYRSFYNECFEDAVFEFLPKNIDAFGIVNLEDELARLDNLAVEFKNDSRSHIFIVIYGGKINKFGELKERPKRLFNYLIQNRKIDAKKIIIMNGGFREKFEFEFWLSQSAQIFPPLSPTVEPEKVIFRGKMKPLPIDLD